MMVTVLQVTDNDGYLQVISAVQDFIVLFKKLSHVHVVPVKSAVLCDELYPLFCCGSTQSVLNVVHIY